MPTDFAALDALYPLPPEDLPRQWVLARDPELAPPGWERRTLNGWHLGAHPDAHVCDLFSSGGSRLGWIIEPLVYLNQEGGAVPTDSLTLPADGCSSGAIERALYGRDERGRSSGGGIEGMWVAIIFGGTEQAPLRRVYLGAIHSVVYSVDHGAVATTHNLIPGLTRDQALSRAFDPLATNRFFTFGLTAFTGLRRLLPNHYLDLDTFQAVRHWPSEALEPLNSGQEGAVAIVKHTHRLLRALSTAYRSYRIFLSAGRDSRAVLASLRPLLDEGAIDLVLSTTVGHDLQSRVDVHAARQLARIAGLPHEVTERGRHSGRSAGAGRAFVRIGESKSGPILSAPGVTNLQPHDGRFILAGMGGEVGRSYYWAIRPSSNGATPEILAKRTGSPGTRTVLEAAGAWIQGLPPGIRASARDTLDLAYVEQRLGCWESSTRYLFPGRPRATSPMTAASNIETMLRLPKRYRVARMLQRDMVAYGWPELLAVPFNQPPLSLSISYYANDIFNRIRRLF
jgi:hypothetical protein